MTEALYIHIPFCRKICAYCDFAKVMTGYFSKKDYLDVLLDELRSLQIEDNSLRTIYIGGGTPSELNEEEIEYLLSYLHLHFPSVEEFTMECNPESLSLSKACLMKKYGINRVSLGVQTTDESILKILNRSHNNNDVKQALINFEKAGIDNINLDFIYGLPNSTQDTLIKDLEFVKNSPCKHVSFYSLQIEEGTLLYLQGFKGISDEEYRKQYDLIREYLSNIGFKRYEVSNFTLPGYESKHNLTYWHDQHYYAVGLAAASYLGNQRRVNTKSLTSYLKGERNPQIDLITPRDEEVEYLMLNLRLEKGFSLTEFQQRFGSDFLVAYKDELEKVSEYIQIIDGFISIKPEYLYTMDNIVLQLIH